MKSRNKKPGRDLHVAPGQNEHGSDSEASTPARVTWTRAQLLVLKARQQSVVDHYSTLGRDLTDRERASLMLALATIRDIAKHLARKRGVVTRKGVRNA